MNANTFPPISCTFFTRATISLVLPLSEERITTLFSVNLLLPVVRNSAALSTYTGSFDLPRIYTSACMAEAYVPPIPINQIPSGFPSRICFTMFSICGRNARAPFTLSICFFSSNLRNCGIFFIPACGSYIISVSSCSNAPWYVSTCAAHSPAFFIHSSIGARSLQHARNVPM